jgi:hypothetical protein
MHPLIGAYVRWKNLYRLVVFYGRDDLAEQKREAWEFYTELLLERQQ